MLILLTGATGYVGGRLLRALEERGERVRCLSRGPSTCGRASARRPRSSPGTCSTRDDPRRPRRASTPSYYLVHSMSSSRQFDEADREAARAFVGGGAATPASGRSSTSAGSGTGAGSPSHLRVPPGGRRDPARVGRADDRVSRLDRDRLRQRVVRDGARARREAAGDGDAALGSRAGPADRDRGRASPTSLAALDHEPQAGELYEIGGADRVTYLELMQEYAPPARTAPRDDPGAGALAAAFEPLALARDPGLRRGRAKARRLAPQRDGRRRRQRARRCSPFGRERRARRSRARSPTRTARSPRRAWSDEAFAERSTYGGVRVGSRLVDTRSAAVPHPPPVAFAPIQRIGGETGWYKGALLWRLRGLLDVLVGGPGLRRGRRDPSRLRIGDTLDFWRVEAFEQDRLLRLRAEMKVPGRAWLQFEIKPRADGSAVTADRDLRAGRALRARLLVRAVALPRLHLRRHAAEPRGRDGGPRAAVRAYALTAHIRHEVVAHPSQVRHYRRGMEEARSVLERFDRIESMRRANAGPVELLGELRALLREAEAWVRVEGGDAGDDAVGRLRQALERDMIGA